MGIGMSMLGRLGKKMSILDSVFSGKNSVTALLADTFASNAMIICPAEQGAYDPETNTYEPTNSTDYLVKFIQEKMKRNVLTHVDGVQIEVGDLVGVIPAHLIQSPLRRRVDRIRCNGANYMITSTEDLRSGDETALVRVLCRRASQ